METHDRKHGKKETAMNNHIFLPATEEGAKLNLTYEQEHTCKVVYKPAEDGKGYVFSELWDIRPEIKYSDSYIIVPVRSVYVDKFTYRADDIFANIIHSSADHCPSNSWKQLLISHGIDCSQCATDGYFYDSKDHSGKTYFTDYQCGGEIKGGHIINSFSADTVPSGSFVYMLPICHNHNSCCTDDTGRNGSGFFMMPRSEGQGIRLRGYMVL